jgi:RNA polymerase sigma-70 factor (ECF subfamily)
MTGGRPRQDPAGDALACVLRAQRARVVAHLARSLGLAHLALAEDAVQSAALRALEAWPVQGVPGNPAGWLYRVARHQCIDSLRREGRHDAWPDDDDPAAASLLPVQPAPAGRFAGELDDDELGLLYAACHPALPVASQVALALRAMTGLELDQIAEGLLCSVAALAQRLARARELVSGLGIAPRLPAGHELAARREAVMTALLLMFHAGMKASGRQGTPPGPAGSGPLALCWESIRLARALAAHPAVSHPDAHALAAQLLFHGARLTGRVDEAGDIIPLPGQARDRWDGGMLRMGLVHLRQAQRAVVLSRWHLQAGIAAEHAAAPDHAGTDWTAIARTYERLLALDGSSAPRLGHAIALAEAGEAARARDLLRHLLPDVPRALQAHTLAALARACARLGEVAEARLLLQQAQAAALHPADARQLARHAQSMYGPESPPREGP